MAAAKNYLWLDGVSGHANPSNGGNWFEVSGYSVHGSSSGSSAGSQPVGKPVEVTLNLLPDDGIVELFSAAVNSVFIDVALITSDNSKSFMMIKLLDVLISNMKPDGEGGAQVTLNSDNEAELVLPLTPGDTP